MKESYQTRLWVNSKDIELHPFVEQFVAGTVTGGVRTLKGVDAPSTIELKAVNKAVNLAVNGKPLELTQFPSDIILNTVTAIVSSLKGVDTVETLHLDIKVSHKT